MEKNKTKYFHTRNLLHSPAYNPSTVAWVDEGAGCFKVKFYFPLIIQVLYFAIEMWAVIFFHKLTYVFVSAPWFLKLAELEHHVLGFMRRVIFTGRCWMNCIHTELADLII